MSPSQYLGALAGAAGALLGITAAMWAAGEAGRPVARRVRIPVAGLPEGLTGFRILHLSDFHRGPFTPAAYLRRGLELARGFEPHLVVHTGDFVSVSAGYARSCGSLMRSLTAPLGVWGVMGNHDYVVGDTQRVKRELAAAGVRLLVNRSIRLAYGGEELWLCGVDDAWLGRPDLGAALAGVPAGAFAILLCHQPDCADGVVGRGVALQLSGHSHGGQVVLPGYGPVLLPRNGRKYPRGLYRFRDGMLLYTSAGLGCISPPIRWNCPPEVGLLTLVPGR